MAHQKKVLLLRHRKVKGHLSQPQESAAFQNPANHSAGISPAWQTTVHGLHNTDTAKPLSSQKLKLFFETKVNTTLDFQNFSRFKRPWLRSVERCQPQPRSASRFDAASPAFSRHAQKNLSSPKPENHQIWDRPNLKGERDGKYAIVVLMGFSNHF